MIAMTPMNLILLIFPILMVLLMLMLAVVVMMTMTGLWIRVTTLNYDDSQMINCDLQS